MFVTLVSAENYTSFSHNNIYQVTENRKLVGAERKFVSFIKEYGKEYNTKEEYVRRLAIFARNLVRAAEHQALDPTAVHGVTPFMDLSPEEFETRFTGLRPSRSGRGAGDGFMNSEGIRPEAPRLDVRGLPKSFDWREKGAVTDVKMQVYHYFRFVLVVILVTSLICTLYF